MTLLNFSNQSLNKNLRRAKKKLKSWDGLVSRYMVAKESAFCRVRTLAAMMNSLKRQKKIRNLTTKVLSLANRFFNFITNCQLLRTEWFKPVHGLSKACQPVSLSVKAKMAQTLRIEIHSCHTTLSKVKMRNKNTTMTSNWLENSMLSERDFMELMTACRNLTSTSKQISD